MKKRIITWVLLVSMIFSNIVPGYALQTENESIADNSRQNGESLIPTESGSEDASDAAEEVPNISTTEEPENENTADDNGENEESVISAEPGPENTAGFEAVVKTDFGINAAAAESDGFTVVEGVLTEYTGEGGDIVIPDGVTEIGEGVFKSNNKISSVEFPDGLIKIGANAFNGTPYIEEVSFPDSLEEIGASAFYGCSSIEQLNFADSSSLKTIGKAAFSNIKVKSLDIPEGVSYIGDSALSIDTLESLVLPSTLVTLGESNVYTAFATISGNRSANALADVTVAEGNASFSTDGRSIMDKQGKTLLYCPAGAGDYTIPKGVETVAAYAFKSYPNKTVAFSDTVTTIEANAFYTAKMKHIDITGSVRTIGESAFYSGSLSSYTLGEGVETIAKNAFGECYITSDLTLPASLTYVGKYGLGDVTKKLIVLNPATVFESSSYYPSSIVFCGYEGSTAQAEAEKYKRTFELLEPAADIEVTGVSITADKTVIAVGDTASLTATVTPEDATDKDIVWSSSDESVAVVAGGVVTGVSAGSADITAASKNGKSDTVKITVNNPVDNGDFVIDDNGVLTGYTGKETVIEIPSNAVKIGDSAFKSNRTVLEVTIPSSVTEIGNSAFEYSAVEKINFSNAGNLLKIGKNAFSITPVKNLDIPEGVAEIGEDALKTNNLEKISLPSSLIVWGKADAGFYEIFANKNSSYGPANLKNINIADGNTMYKSVGGAVYSADGKTLVFCPSGKTGTLAIAAGTEAIGESAFRWSQLSAFEFPASVASIGKFAFYASKATSITIPGTVKTLDKQSFYYSALRDVVIEDGVEYIGEQAFALSFVNTAVIPASVTYIGREAFDFENGYNKTCWLKIENDNITLADEFIPYPYSASLITTIYANAGSKAQKYVNDKNAEKGKALLVFASLGDYKEITAVSLNKDNITLKRAETAQLLVTVAPEGAKPGLIAWSSSEPGVASVTKDGLVTAIELGTTVVSATAGGRTAFCEITVAKDAGESDFTIDTRGYITGTLSPKETDVVIPEMVNGVNVVGIAANAFKGNSYIKTLTILSNVIEICDGAFSNCGSLYEINFSTGLKTLGKGVFSSCTSLTTVDVPEGIESIPESTFSSCGKLTTVKLPSTLKTIKESAFARTALAAIELPEGLEKIETLAFLNCSVLETIHIPASLISLGDEYIGDVFEQDEMSQSVRSMKALTVAEGNPVFSEHEGLLYNKAGTELLFAPRGIVNAVIREGTEKIGDYAFFICFELKTVDMASTVKVVGHDAFHYCEFMEELVLPEGLERVENSGFFGCEAWEEVVIPASVNYIGAYGFAECGATELVIPEGITRIEEFAFWGYEGTLASLTLPSTLTYIGNSAFAWATEMETLVIPEGVTYIGNQAFGRSDSLKNVTLPSTLKEIGEGAFLTSVNASGKLNGELREIYIPASVTKLGKNVFSVFGNTLTVVVDDLNGYIAEYAAANGHLVKEKGAAEISVSGVSVSSIKTAMSVGQRKKLTATVLPLDATNKSVNWASSDAEIVSIDENGLMTAIAEGKATITVTTADGGKKATCKVTVVAVNESDFEIVNGVLIGYHGSASDVIIPETVREIGAYAFGGDDHEEESGKGITSVFIPASVEAIRDGAFKSCGSLEIVEFEEGSKLKSVGDSAFSFCHKMTTIKLPDTVETIGASAFYGCAFLSRFDIPDAAVSIGDGAFAACTKIKEFNFSDSGKLKTIGAKAFYSCFMVKEFILAEGLETVGDEAFKTDRSFVSIYIPSTVTQLGSSVPAVFGTVANPELAVAGNLKEVTVSPANSVYKSVDGVVYSKDGKSLLFCPAGKKGSLAVAGGTESIGDYAFMRSALSHIELPNTLDSIGVNAFYKTALVNVEIPGSVRTIGNHAFFNNTSLQAVEIGNGVKRISDSAFSLCNKLAGVVVPESVEYIGRHAFDELGTFIRIEGTDVEIAEAAFSDLYSIIVYGHTGSTAEAYVKNDNAANPDSKLAFVSIEQSIKVTDIELNASSVVLNKKETFDVKAAVLPENATVKTLVWSSKDPSIATVTQEGLVTAVKEGAVEIVVKSPDGVSAVLSVTVTDDGTVSDYVVNDEGIILAYHGNEESIVIPKTVNGIDVTGIGDGVFQKNAALQSITIPSHVKSIGDYAFDSCKLLQNVYFEEGLESIGQYAFAHCAYVEHLVLPNSVTFLDTGAFYTMDRLQSIVLSENITAIPSKGFETCYNLRRIDIPEGVTVIGDHAFYECEGMEEVTLPLGLEIIGEDAFTACVLLEEIIVPEGVTTIEKHAFMSCTSLDTLYLPSTAQYLGGIYIGDMFEMSGVVGSANLQRVVVSGDNTYFSSHDGLLYNKDGTELLFCPRGLTSAEVIEGTTKIGNYAFFFCLALEEVKLPESLEIIGKSAFSVCEGLKSIVIPNKVYIIEGNAFASCVNLGEISMPTGLKIIGNMAFGGCDTVTGITLPEGVTTIGDNAFYVSSKLEYVFIPSSVTSIGADIFKGCPLNPAIHTDSRSNEAAGYAIANDIKLVVVGGTPSPGNNSGKDKNKQPEATNTDAAGTLPADVSVLSKFTDVRGDERLVSSIQRVVEMKLFNGVSETEFAPDNEMTRAMLVTVLYRYAGSPAVSQAAAFKDVEGNIWYSDAVAWASQIGIIKGYNGEMFGADDGITGEQIAVILRNLANYFGYDISSTDDPSSHGDSSSVSAWAVEAMQWANTHGIISGTNSGESSPQTVLSRAEAIIVIVNFMDFGVK